MPIAPAALGLALLLQAARSTAFPYSLAQDFSGSSFYDYFTFANGHDVSANSSALYVNQTYALGHNLTWVQSGVFYTSVDTSSVTPESAGRPSIRLESRLLYDEGLFIMDLTHIPDGCGTWPSIWFKNQVGSQIVGELDIIEGINGTPDGHSIIHTADGCYGVPNRTQIATPLYWDCPVNDPPSPEGYDGCGSLVPASVMPGTFGSVFNQNGGGVYATKLDNSGIDIWFFPRSSIPQDIVSGNPNPSQWPAVPLVSFPFDCCTPDYFRNLKLIIDTNLCGNWAISDAATRCPTMGLCSTYVASNPTAFSNAYWGINSIKVYADQNRTALTSFSPNPSVVCPRPPNTNMTVVSTPPAVLPFNASQSPPAGTSPSAPAGSSHSAGASRAVSVAASMTLVCALLVLVAI
ncbi:uncharacterized protein BJ171DRAFT_509397 [Polychytrium aggregatum]|uniref:uncharacterized protein n=1 Tax=Polychytrium aggregatum TaxID=110093 RepID=UPI0022FE161C|nr:uncharacterized protein BJ171DRAFT_509397 [Polychytrium aggregatum]KAI9203717.1 hypothetical protein BJ171DRAFT_509397 [Polychytrium aggregatum]